MNKFKLSALLLVGMFSTFGAIAEQYSISIYQDLKPTEEQTTIKNELSFTNKEKYKLIYSTKLEIKEGLSGGFELKKTTPYNQKIEIKTKENNGIQTQTEEVNASNVKSGYSVSLKFVNNEMIKLNIEEATLTKLSYFDVKDSMGNIKLGLPERSVWSYSGNILADYSKPFTIDSPIYTIDGKELKSIYLVEKVK